MERNNSLPNNWVLSSLGECCFIARGGSPRPIKEFLTNDADGVNWIKISDATASDKYIFTTNEKIKPSGIVRSRLVNEGDFLLSNSMSFGRPYILRTKGCIHDGWLVLSQYDKFFNQSFLYYLLSSPVVFKQFNELAAGSTVRNLNIELASRAILPIPPFHEQHRIVAKIEALFSELDKGIESFKTAREQLKTYRQALLKHAFSGKLTEQWRAKNQSKLETAEALLQRIQTEREQRYQQQLKDWEAKGKQGSRPKAPKTLPPLTAEELAELPELPEGWSWIKFGEIFDVFVGSTPSRKIPDYWKGEISWVSSGEVAFCRIKSTKEKITMEGYLNASTEIHPAGSVMLAMIGEGKTRGQAAILDIDAAHNQNTAAIRINYSGCPSEYLYQYLFYQYENTRKAGSGNNQKALNKERVSDMCMPFCSIAEMNVVVSEIDEKLSIVGQLDQTLTTALQQAETLRQSILKKAFSGQLVPQDPNDEPASVLLERIQAEKTQTNSQATRQRGKN
jgi:type I restriction enzyme, S subunit